MRREAAGGLFRLVRRADLIRPMRRARRGKSPMGCGAEPHVSYRTYVTAIIIANGFYRAAIVDCSNSTAVTYSYYGAVIIDRSNSAAIGIIYINDCAAVI